MKIEKSFWCPKFLKWSISSEFFSWYILFKLQIFLEILLKIFDSSNIFEEIPTGCPKKSWALGFKIVMTSRGKFWSKWVLIVLTTFLSTSGLPLNVIYWVTPECNILDVILFWTLKYSIETRILRIVTYPKAQLFFGTPCMKSHKSWDLLNLNYFKTFIF